MTKSLASPFGIKSIPMIDLLRTCVRDKQDQAAWSEFMRRVLPKVKSIVRAALGRILHFSCFAVSRFLAESGEEAEDLVQDVILRIVKNNCRLLSRFSGSTEDQFFVYLAVVSRSTVLDWFRRRAAPRRWELSMECRARAARPSLLPDLDGGILQNEVVTFVRGAPPRELGWAPRRDLHIMRLYYLKGLSTARIADIPWIGLSASGVKKALARTRIRMAAVLRAPASHKEFGTRV
jgi:RNA polymerase sigma factor (sigma-70 family)